MRHVNKDIFNAIDDGEITAIIQQANCQGVMNKGLAKQVRQKFPAHHLAYKSSEQRLGDTVITQDISTGVWVCSVLGQRYYGKGKQTNYAALAKGVVHCMTILNDVRVTDVGIPKYIGCGLAGGDWDVVYPIIYDAAIMCGIDVKLYYV